MLNKRLTATVVIKNEMVVQSFGFKNYLPIGKPAIVIENLDRWGVDEIIILNIDRSITSKGPNFKLIEDLKKIKIKTPLTYGGGIRSSQDALDIVKCGIERVVIDSLLRENIKEVNKIAKLIGQQAVIGSLPLSIYKEKIMWLDYKSGLSTEISVNEIKKKFTNIVSELILIDWNNEGSISDFNLNLIHPFKNIESIKLILFGGLNNSRKINSLLNMKNISAIAIGNSLNYKEHEYQSIKKKIINSQLRPNYYEN